MPAGCRSFEKKQISLIKDVIGLKTKLLSSLRLPDDLKKLNLAEQTRLCKEIRETIIETVSKNGGHLASNLGVVELTLAIHRAFDSPKDKIIFDVGHQCYTHKLLTGRLDEFSTLRTKDGLCGFMKPSESLHDPVISGHSSTSISAALGIAQAMKLNGDSHHAIAVIGDGALTGGLAYEGLNNAGKSKTNIIVILNYNEMSISKNTGGIAEYLSKLRTKKSYKRVKRTTKKVLSSLPIFGKPLERSISISKDILKGRILHSTLFEDLGFEFVGPVDGHDLKALDEALNAAKSVCGPVLIQVNTVKGKGYKPAEANPGEYHGVAGFNVKTGRKPEHTESFVDVFANALLEEAAADKKICAITAAMKYGTGLNLFSKTFPERFFDVGIAEEHAVTFAAGLAHMGYIPVFAVYSSFLQRCYDQLIHDLSIANLHCVLAVCNAGIVGEDGVTHQGLFDVPFLTTIPNISIYSPSAFAQVGYCLKRALHVDGGIAVVRLPKGGGSSGSFEGDYSLAKRNSSTLIISYGRLSEYTQNAAERLGADSLTLLKISPIGQEIIDIINGYERAYFFEESYFEGSIGQKLMARCRRLEAFGINSFVQHMKTDEALSFCDLSEEAIVSKITDGIQESYAKT